MSVALLERQKVKPKVKVITKATNKYISNLHNLRLFSRLLPNWNGYDSKPVDKAVILKMRYLLEILPVQPDVFPNAMGFIQFEYEKKNGEYIDFEFLPENKIQIFRLDDINNINVDDKENVEIIKFEPEKIVKVVEEFYGF